MDPNIDTIEQTNELQESIIEEIQLYVEPVNNDAAKKISDILVDGKLFLSKLDDIHLNTKIITKTTPIFCLINRFSKDEADPLGQNKSSEMLRIEKIVSNTDFALNNILVSENICYPDADGIFILTDNTPKIVHVCYDTPFNIKLAEDSMNVMIDFYPPTENQSMPNLEEILQKISQLGEIQDIDSEVINSSINYIVQRKEPLLDVIVAMGQDPIDGENWWLENVIENAQKENINNSKKDNLVTFHRNKANLSVGKDQLIAKIHKAIEGEDGFDVFGKLKKHVQAKEISVKLSPNIYSSPEDENKIHSKIDGFLEILENNISIKDTLEISGNIDVNSGNIDGFGSLKVSGNVVNDMKLNLSKNIEINGYVGDALIEAGKNVVVKGGFLGSGKGNIRAGGDIELKFIENQKVFSRGSLKISKEAINSELYIRDKIISEGSQFTIIGGYTIASESIELYDAGNEYNTNTILEVGCDYKKKLSLNNYSNSQIALKKELEVVDQEIIEISSTRRKSPKSTERVIFLANRHKEIVAEMESMKAKKKELSSEINSPTSSKIVIKNIIYPGVKIVINGRQKIITEQIKSKTFVLSKEYEIIAI